MSAEDRGRAVHNIKEMELAVTLPESQRLCKLQTSESVAFARYFLLYVAVILISHLCYALTFHCHSCIFRSF